MTAKNIGSDCLFSILYFWYTKLFRVAYISLWYQVYFSIQLNTHTCTTILKVRKLLAEVIFLFKVLVTFRTDCRAQEENIRNYAEWNILVICTKTNFPILTKHLGLHEKYIGVTTNINNVKEHIHRINYIYVYVYVYLTEFCQGWVSFHITWVKNPPCSSIHGFQFLISRQGLVNSSRQRALVLCQLCTHTNVPRTCTIIGRDSAPAKGPWKKKLKNPTQPSLKKITCSQKSLGAKTRKCCKYEIRNKILQLQSVTHWGIFLKSYTKVGNV